MQYFKHFSNARSSLKLQEVRHEFGMEGYGRYWALFELMSEKFDGESVVIELHLKEILTALEFRLKSSLKTFSDFLTSVELISIISQTDTVVVIECPMLLELMDRDSKYNKIKKPKNALPPQQEEDEEEDLDKDLKKEIREEVSAIPPDLLNTIKCTMMYPDAIIEEVRKDAWLKYSASTKPDKNWRRFVGNYFHNEKEKINKLMVSKGKVVKKENSGNQSAEIASKLFSQISRVGRDGVKEVLKGLSPLEIKALDIFGLPSEIYNCPNDFAGNDLRKRLKAAYEQAISEEQGERAC